MSVTIYDVARRAGVGIGTVSRAINDSPQIRPETKKRVMEAIRELGYTPHTMAKRLATKRIGIIAAIMPFYTGHFYHELLRGIQKALTEFEYDLLVHFVDRPEKLRAYLDRTLSEKRCDGLLIISMDIPEEYVDKLQHARLPVVVVDRGHDRLDCIQVENEQGAYLATQHLIRFGHRKIGMISGNRHSEPAKQRYEGYVRALNEDGLAVRPEWFVSADMLNATPDIQQNDGFNIHAGYAGMHRLLALGDDRPTAVFAASDILAVGAMRAANEAGLTIPNDLAVIGFDDIELADYLSLTTMQQPMYEMGKLAVDRVMEKIDSESDEVRQFRLSTRLIERHSTQPIGS